MFVRKALKYAEEINGDDTEVWEYADCRQESLDGI